MATEAGRNKIGYPSLNKLYMVSKIQLIEEVLELVDETPLTNVDIKPILDKYSVGLEFNEQKTLRNSLRSTLIELEKNGDIKCYITNFSASSGEQFMNSNSLVAST